MKTNVNLYETDQLVVRTGRGTDEHVFVDTMDEVFSLMLTTGQARDLYAQLGTLFGVAQ